MKRSESLGDGENGRRGRRRGRSRRKRGVKKAENLITMNKRLLIIVFPLKKKDVPFSPKMQLEKEREMRK